MVSGINAKTPEFCFIDFDVNGHRQKLATAAAFVDATDSRYGFSCKDLRYLGGSEISRIPECIANDHEWGCKVGEGIETKPPIGGNRIVVKLYWDTSPLACENFATLCANGSALPSTTDSSSGSKVKPPPIGESGKPLTYRGSKVHRVVPNFVVQGGDFVFGNGSGGESIYNGKKFKDDRPGLALKHDRRGILSMGNSGKNSNSSQFFFTFAAAPQCDGKHVVFGEIVSGWEVLTAMEALGTPDGDAPQQPLTITDCGIYAPFHTPSCGYWYDQPDADSFSGVSPTFMVRPRAIIIGPSDAVVQRFQAAMQTHVSHAVTLTSDQAVDAQAVQVEALLANYAVDVVLVAPACKAIMSHITLPTSWMERSGCDMDVSQVVLLSKPVEALSRIHNDSWIAQHRLQWHLDGKV